MRFLPILVLAALPGPAWAQLTSAEVQKAAQSAPSGDLTAAELGLPVDPVLPKAGLLVASRAADSAMSDFDADKVAGNSPVSAPLAQRTKAPGTRPDSAPAASDLGAGPEGEKVAELVVAKAMDSRTTSYDTDKIDGNPETYPPLAMRQKALGLVPEGVTTADFGQPASPPNPKSAELVASHADGRASIYDEDKIDGNEPPPAPLADREKAPSYREGEAATADFGLPANPEAPKTADLAASHQEAVPSVYDDDKIAGNEETFVSDGPLAERQKYPSELAEGTDPATLGQPAIQAPKEADLSVSKAESAVPNVEDNDKIAGNVYVEPPLLPRQKQPSMLPDPVADADMGQPATAAPKQDLAVSKSAEGQPTAEDNDKIVGNPVVEPPLAERAKMPATEPALAGLGADELGQLTAPVGEKTAASDISKTAEAVATEYDEDKIAGNSYQDPGLGDEFYEESYDPPPPPELTAQVRALLDDPATKASVLESVATRAPTPVVGAFQAFVGQLFDAPQVRDLMAEDIARVYMNVGLTPDNPAALGRVVAEYMAAFGEAEVVLGMSLRPVADQRIYLAGMVGTAEALLPSQCGPFLDGTMEAAQSRRLLLSALATLPEAEQSAVMASRAAAILGFVQGDTPFIPLTEEQAQMAREKLGADAFAAIDAMENADDLLAAFGDPYNAAPEDSCTVQKLIINAALANAGPDSDLGVRYLVEHGWQN